MKEKIKKLNNEILNWFLKDVIPRWENEGVDFKYGGFHEEINKKGPITLPKRTRVVCRQIYFFYIAYKLKNKKNFLNLIDHGAEFLFQNLLSVEKDSFIYSNDISSNKKNNNLYLYEQSFALLGLAVIYKKSTVYSSDALFLAKKIIKRIRELWGINLNEINNSFFWKDHFLSDPYMHLLESFLFWEEILSDSEKKEDICFWRDLSKELINLTFEKFIDPNTNFIHEAIQIKNTYKDVKNPFELKIYPGHQYEWGSLIYLYGINNKSDCHYNYGSKIIRDIEIYGIDKKHNTIANEINTEYKITDKSFKLWPQTERIKAWGLIIKNNKFKKDLTIEYKNYISSLKGFLKFIDNDHIGCWKEIMLPNGKWIEKNVKASSLYHIASAIDILNSINKEL